MRLADDELKRHYQRFVADNRNLERKKCPSAKELGRAAKNEMWRRRKLNLLDHVFSCGACVQEYETLRLLYQEERKTADVAVRSFRLGFNYKYLVSAVSLLIVMAAIYLLRPWTEVPTEEVYRDAGKEKILLQVPTGVVSSPPVKFQWSQGNRVDYYQVYLLDEELSRLWVSEKISVNSLSLPQEVVKRLERGKIYFWKVRIYGKNASVEESELRDFKIIQ
jgi:hypothetical protein